ncbi:ATP-binding protein [Streptomyces sp. NPDC057136]|uniref:ATP-binding protein n=1 Tax=Streptomyces sp. NPDC057136 TaxID=3346029 RepID=UPI0036329062
MSSGDGAVIRRWSRHPRCVGQARSELRTALGSWGLALLSDAAVLVLSELMTNAGQHARVSPGREIETRFLVVNGNLRIEVHDASSALPQESEPDLEACGARGLLLVAAAADTWGFGDRVGPGKVVWAQLGFGATTDDGVRHG